MKNTINLNILSYSDIIIIGNKSICYLDFEQKMKHIRKYFHFT